MVLLHLLGDDSMATVGSLSTTYKPGVQHPASSAFYGSLLVSHPEDIQVTSSLQIPASEVHFEYSRASGPGGQHVNKVETRVTLCFDIEASGVLSAEQRDQLRSRLASRMSKEGVLRVSCEEARSQIVNRELVQERFATLLSETLAVKKKRIPTKATKGSQRRRVEGKRRRGEIKRGREKGWDEN